MNEEEAVAIATALNGETWQSGGNIWLVLLKRTNGSLVVISDDVVCEYESEHAFENASASMAISLG